jgi:hypothetical protein
MGADGFFAVADGCVIRGRVRLRYRISSRLDVDTGFVTRVKYLIKMKIKIRVEIVVTFGVRDRVIFDANVSVYVPYVGDERYERSPLLS